MIDFLGKIVDQYGSGIEGVDVNLYIARTGIISRIPVIPLSDFKLKTNKSGEFHAKAKGFRVVISPFEKRGYEFIKDPGSRMVFDKGDGWKPNSLKPVIFKMRKKGEGTFLLLSSVSCLKFSRSESGMQKADDFIAEKLINEKDFNNQNSNGFPLYRDLTAVAVFNVKTKRWQMELRSDGKNSGILFSNELNYVAPVDGYEKRCVIDPELFKRKFNISNVWEQGHEVYIYIRSREPSLYSRITVAAFEANDQEIYFVTRGCLINPYGERNLEPATDLPAAVSKYLRQEVEKAFNQGGSRRPTKPDLQALVRQDGGKKAFGISWP